MNRNLLVTGVIMTVMYLFNLATELFIENVEFTDYVMPGLVLVLFFFASLIVKGK